MIQNRQNKVQFSREFEDILERAVEQVFSVESIPETGEVSIVLVDNQKIQQLNATYRGIDQPTDVLSFPQLEPGEQWSGDELLLGDIVICMERAVLQAQEYGHSLSREMAYLLVHGLYHLLGYDHDTDNAQKQMRAKEEQILSALGLVRDV